MSWFRVDSDLPTHPKVGLVAERLKLTRREAGGLLTFMWAWASVHARDGRLPKHYLQSLAAALDVPAADTERVVGVLLEARVLDRSKTRKDELVIHGFLERNGRQLREMERSRKRRVAARTDRGQTAVEPRTDRELTAVGPRYTRRNGTLRDGT